MSIGEGTEPRAWLVRGSKNPYYDDWQIHEGVSGVDFGEVPDLTGAGDLPAVRAVVRAAMPDRLDKAVGNYAAQLNAFANRIALGDTVILPIKGSGQLAFGVVTGDYEYRTGDRVLNHVRVVDWKRTDVPRAAVLQDLRFSLGAFSTVVEIQRHDAAWRLRRLLDGAPTDPGSRPSSSAVAASHSDADSVDIDTVIDTGLDVVQYTYDRVLARIQERFAGNRLADLVAAILEAEGLTCKVSPPGADGGKDIVAGSGVLGISAPTIIAQAKSEPTAVGSPIVDQLLGVVSQHRADHGLLVALGGVTPQAQAKIDAQQLKVAVWTAKDVIRRLFDHYDAMPDDIRAEIPLRREWVIDESASA